MTAEALQVWGSAIPMDHQAQDVLRLDHQPRVNVWNGLGTGKTLTAVWRTFKHWREGRIDQIVLVCPSMCLADWMHSFTVLGAPGELVEFIDCRPPDQAELVDRLTGPLEPRRLVVTATTYHSLRTLFTIHSRGRYAHGRELDIVAHVRGRRVALIIDEAQAVALPKSGQSYGARTLAGAARTVTSVTATPIGSPLQLRLWGLLSLTRPDLLTSVVHDERYGEAPGTFGAFKSRYAVLNDPTSLHRAFPVAVHTRLWESELLERAAAYTCRRRKEDCLTLPDKVYNERSFELPENAQRLMDSILDDDRAVLESGEAITPDNALEARLRCTELVGGWIAGMPIHHAKLDLLKEVIAQLSDDLGESAPILVWASRTRELMAAALVMANVEPGEAQRVASWCMPADAQPSADEYRAIVARCREQGVAMIHGKTSERNRDEIQAAWRAGKLRYVVAHPGVAGAGLNWQHVRASIYYSQPMGVISRMQSEDRVHRKGLTHLALYYDLTMANGPDQAVMHAHRGQRDAERALLDWICDRIERM